MRSLSLSKQSLLLLLIGMVIRLPSLVSPISEGHRNAQTATLTAGMLENGKLRLDPIAPWRGDLDARIAMELPLYSFAALAINTLPGVSLDMAGRMTSLIFWILSFIALQALWRKTLPPKATFWANLLFILAPMNWYLSTAFMPESLLQLLAIGFMVFALDYARRSTWAAFVGLFITAFLGLLVKFPGFVHLGLFAALVLLDRQGWRSLLRPALWGAGLIIGAAILAWGEYVKATNLEHFPCWAGSENLLGFIQPGRSRLSLSYYIPLVGYNLAFVLPFLVAPFALLGAMQACRSARNCFTDRVWLYLAGSLLIYWLVWAKAAPSHSYYNLQNLVLFSALFGLGTARTLDWASVRASPLWTARMIRFFLGIALFGSGVSGFLYLVRPDHVAIEVAKWVKANTEENDVILYQPRHAAAVMDYEHQPLLSHLTGRRTWIWTRSTPSGEKNRAIASSAYAVVTHPPGKVHWLERLRQRFKGPTPAPPKPATQETQFLDFTELKNTPAFTVYKRDSR